MRPIKLSPPPKPPENAGPYAKALHDWARSMVAEIEAASEENDRSTPYLFTINDLGTSTLRTLSGTSASTNDARDFLLTMARDLKKRGVLR